MTVGVLVPAGGAGVRLGPGDPKALRPLAGEPVVVHAVRGLRACPEVGPVVVAAPAGRVDATRKLLSAYDLCDDVLVVAGGAERHDSVVAALAALRAGVDRVLVHDAARCLVPREVVARVVAALRAGADAVVPVLAVTDTVKRVEGDRVVGTVDRVDLRAVQTPQGFRRDVLSRAHAAHALPAEDRPHTDDAGLVERLGREVVVVPGSPEAFKVTGPLDVLLAEAVLAARRSAAGRAPG